MSSVARSLHLSLLAVAVLAPLAGPVAAETGATPITVRIDAGELVGRQIGTIASFKGVPYAVPPIGERRWRPPAAPPPWTSARDAGDFGASCIQAEMSRRVPPTSAAARASEDCLTLNVWAPAAHAARLLPVLVWIHGGGNTQGSSAVSYYDGSAFARDGVVLVSFNYRLGALGFFAHPRLTAAAGTEPLANYGLMDQIAALKWVSRNIAAFGGNPHNVTVVGESAGGLDVLALLTAPSAEGLFQKAIVESAGVFKDWPNLKEAEERGSRWASLLGLDGERATAQELRAVAPERLASTDDRPATGPVLDGALLSMPPLKAFAEGRVHRIPLIIGTNDNEGSLLGPSPSLDDLPGASAAVLTRLRPLYGRPMTDPELASAVFRDARFAAPARIVAQHGTSAAPVFLYQFEYVVSLLRARRAGADHASEIPFVFDSWMTNRLSEADLAMTRLLHGCWVAFAQTGAPRCAGMPEWPAYSGREDRSMQLGEVVAFKPVPHAAVLDSLANHLLTPGAATAERR
jgi:para-nitrobenzyl esterase